MGLFNRKKNVEPTNINTEERNIGAIGGLGFNSYSTYSSNSNLQLSAVNCALQNISNSVATLSLELFKDTTEGRIQLLNNDVYKLMNFEPSKNFTRFHFMKMTIYALLLRGNSYAHIIRDDKGNASEVKFILPDAVTVKYNQLTDIITYYINGSNKPINSNDVLHFKQFSNDGILGTSTLFHGSNILKQATDVDAFSSSFFKSGAAVSGVITSNSQVNQKQREQIQSAWSNTFNSQTPGVVVLEGGLEYKPVSISPVDADLLLTRNFNVLEIARLFNINPSKLMDYTNSSFSTLEQMELSYQQNTIYPYLVMIEAELNKKLFNESDKGKLFFKFDTAEALITDKKTLAEFYNKMIQNGIMTVNEVRSKFNLTKAEGGDKLYIQLNMKDINEPDTDNTDKNNLPE